MQRLCAIPHPSVLMRDFIHVPRGVVGGRNYHHGGGRGGRGGRSRGGRGRFHQRGGGGGRPEQKHDISKDRIETLGKASATSLNIAVEGCCHGEIDRIYERLQAHEKQTGEKVHLLICCGDFQSLRNPSDFLSSSIPPKYRRLGAFPKYYSGEMVAPILTIFIGGNHEASQPLRELYYGGWVAPNIYYMGAAGVVQFGGTRIGGLGGIYASHHYKLGHFECPPYENSTLRSVYHVRNVDIYRMKCLSKSNSRIDIMASHDWPLGIEQHGNTEELLRKKPFFKAEVKRNELGSPPNRELLDVVKPTWWFAAHLHVKFSATVKHKTEESKDTSSTNKVPAQIIPSQVGSAGKIAARSSQVDTEQRASSIPPEVEAEPNANLMPSDVKTEANVESIPTQAGNIENVAAQLIPSQIKMNPNMDNSMTTHHPDVIEGSSNVNSGNDQGQDDSPKYDGIENDHQTETEFIGLESSCKVEPDLTDLMTKFLALDKCLPRRQYLSILHLKGGSTKKKLQLEFDPEWLAILRKTHSLQSAERREIEVPEKLEEISKDDVQWVMDRLKEMNGQDEKKGFCTIPTSFQPTVPFHSDALFKTGSRCPPLPFMGNPQTDFLLDLLQLDHILTVPFDSSLTPRAISENLRGVGRHHHQTVQADDNEIDIDMDMDEVPEVDAADENEIEIDEDEEHEQMPNSGVAAMESTDPVEPLEVTAPTKKARIDD